MLLNYITIIACYNLMLSYLKELFSILDKYLFIRSFDRKLILNLML